MDTIKALGLVLLGLIIWSAITYAAIAFLKVEANPSFWSQNVRGGMLFAIFCYVCCIPILVFSIKDEL